MKRFTATEKWADAWFRKLKPAHKLLWQYIVDSCDQAGVWKVDMELASFSIGAKVESAAALAAFEGRVREVGRDRWWIPGFIVFQFNGKLSEDCPYHVKVIKLLEEHRLAALWEAYLKDLSEKDTTGDTTPHPIAVGIGEGIGEGIGKRESEGVVKTDLPIPEHLNTAAFLSEWDAWKLYRRGKKKGDQKESFKRHLKFLATLSEPDARASIDKSIQCGWTGLFAVAQPTLSKPAPKWRQDQENAAAIKQLEGEFLATQDEVKRAAIRAKLAELKGAK